MFGWWKKNDGFEWREYVRTTILLKRKQRRDRVVAAKDHAVAGAKRAGQAGVAAGRAGAEAGRVGAAASRKGAAALWHGLSAGLQRGVRGTARGLGVAFAWLGAAPRRVGAALVPLFGSAQWQLKPLARRLTEAPLRGMLRNVGLVALIVTLAWLPGRGLARETWIVGAIAAVALGVLLLARMIVGERLLPATVSSRLPGWGWLVDHIPAISPKVVGGAIAAVVLALGGGIAWQAWRSGGLATPKLAALQIPGFAAEQTIEGRASAIDGDTLRIGRDIIQLAGIEAPDRAQRCSRPGNPRWRCGDAAREALSRLVGRHRITCKVTGGGEGRVMTGTCDVGGSDLADTLVRKGHVFAQTGLFARYASAEAVARDAKAGLWRGTADRPQAWRDKLWDEAKRSAPDGCPIKGEVRSGAKVYLLPWSPRYERARISQRRGERWFCSEEEARSAGWTPSERS
jgi:endonuclease YncB( thermonuclease family)